jgi:hypothetical protein
VYTAARTRSASISFDAKGVALEGSFTPPTVAGTGQSGFGATPPPLDPPPSDTPPAGGWPPSDPPPPPVRPIPWEEPGRPFVTALVETVQLIFSRPTEAFQRMPLNTELLRPILFALILGMIGAVAETVYDSVWSMAAWKFLPWMRESDDTMFGVFGGFIMLFFMPLLIPVGLLLSSAVTHLMLLLLGAGQRGWTVTFRVSCYAYASALLLIVPIAGGALSLVAGLIFGTVGLSVVHGTSRGRAFTALVLPMALCCAIVSMVFVVFGAALLAGVKGLGNL